MAVCPGAHLGNGEFAIRAVRNDALARLKMEQDTIKVYGDDRYRPGSKSRRTWSLWAIQFPPKRTRMRLRNGST
jgi:hypothetical protein